MTEDEYDNNEYKASCGNCNKEQSLFTQPDNWPEYYATVKMKCPDCGAFVVFSLPVN